MSDYLDQFIFTDKSTNVNVKHIFKEFEQDFIRQGGLIKINHNPMIIDYNNSY